MSFPSSTTKAYVEMSILIFGKLRSTRVTVEHYEKREEHTPRLSALMSPEVNCAECSIQSSWNPLLRHTAGRSGNIARGGVVQQS